MTNTRKYTAGALLLITTVFLTSCSTGPSKEELACVEAGGSWEVDYMMPITTYIKSGNVMIPITNYVPIYGCDS